MTAVAAAIVIADNESVRLAVGAALILAARAMASIPFVRTQIARLHHRKASIATSDAFQAGGALLAVGAVVVDTHVVAGTVAVVLLAATQSRWLRRPPPPAKVLGVHQMALGLTVEAATAIGVLVLT